MLQSLARPKLLIYAHAEQSFKSLRQQLIYAPVSHRCITARPEQTPFAERQRKFERPLDTFTAPGTKQRLRKGESRFVLSPTKVKWRPEATSEQRRTMQLCNSSDDLLLNLGNSIAAGKVDASVIGAALQRCGQTRWWSTLKEVRKLQEHAKVSLRTQELSIYLIALAKSVKGEHGFGSMPERESQALKLGKQAWDEVSPTMENGTKTCVLVNSALRLCTCVSGVTGLQWAEQLWRWAEEQGVHLDTISYHTFALVLAEHGLAARVDKVLEESMATGHAPNSILLGGLVNALAAQRDWRRAEELWKRLVGQYHVQPNRIAYGARAKVHLLCGRPAAAARLLDEMQGNGLGLNYKLAESQVQALLIVYHSSSAEPDLKRLSSAIVACEATVSEASAWQKRTWAKLKAVAHKVKTAPSSHRLHDLLVEWKAQQSALSKWPNHASGSKYLQDT